VCLQTAARRTPARNPQTASAAYHPPGSSAVAFFCARSSASHDICLMCAVGAGAAVLPAPPDLSGKVVRANWNATALAYLGDSVWEVRGQHHRPATAGRAVTVALVLLVVACPTHPPRQGAMQSELGLTAGGACRSCTCGGTTSTRRAGCRCTMRGSPRRSAPRRRCGHPCVAQPHCTGWPLCSHAGEPASHDSPGSTPTMSAVKPV
jgi:hypothetical protein